MISGLSRDEMDALVQVSKMSKGSKPSACIGRNAKKLVGIKLLVPRRDGTYVLTDKGSEALFVNRCIRGLQALANDATTRLDSDVAQFLVRKGHIAESNEGHQVVTEKGHECLEDISKHI